MATYPVYIRDAAKNRVEIMINPTTPLREFIQRMNNETRPNHNMVKVGVKEYKIDQHGNKTLAELGITPNCELILMDKLQERTQESLTDEVNKLKGSISTLPEQLTSSQNQIKQLENRNKLLIEQLNSKENEINSIKNNMLAELKAGSDKLSEQIKSKENEINSIKANLSEQIKGKDTEISTIKADLGKKTSELKALSENLIEQLKEKDIQIQSVKVDLANKGGELESASNNLSDQIKSKDTEISSINDALAKKTAELKAVSDNLNELLKDKDTDIISIKAKLARKNEKLKTVSDNLSQMKDKETEISMDIERLNSVIDTLDKILNHIFWYLDKDSEYTKLKETVSNISSKDLKSKILVLEKYAQDINDNHLCSKESFKVILENQFSFTSNILLSIISEFNLETNKCMMKVQSNQGALREELDGVIADIHNLRFGCIVDKSRALFTSSSDIISLVLSEINAKNREKQYLGLPNLGNTCYLSSVVQVLAHCREFTPSPLTIEDISKYGLASSLKNILDFLRDPSKSSRDIGRRLKDFIGIMAKENAGFELGKQNDPKQLLLYLLKAVENSKSDRLFLWKKHVKFTHELHTLQDRASNAYLRLNHSTNSPEQHNWILILTPRKEIIRQWDIIMKFQEMFMCDGSDMKSYCEVCQGEVMGNENYEETVDAKFIIFAVSDGRGKCDVSNIMTIRTERYTLELKSLIVRIENDTSSEHNCAICREDNSWVIFNDDQVSKLETPKLDSIYMLFYQAIRSSEST